MNCCQARFLLYAYLDRGMSVCEAETLSRHLAECRACEARGRSARGLARLLHSCIERAPAPPRLVLRLRQGLVPAAPPRSTVYATAAAVLVMILPLVASVAGRPAEAVASVSQKRLAIEAPPKPKLVSRRLTGTLICLDCEARIEAGLPPLSASKHEPAFCAANGEVWRLMFRDPSAAEASAGQTVTVEGVGFPESGFLRASWVGY
ncbi:MAG: anti-sigma factor family protein [Thermoanaerobaculia bacterium]